MKTLADLKRKMVAGTVFWCEHHRRPEQTGKRTVLSTYTTYVRLQGGDDRDCILITHYDTADRWKFDGSDAVTLLTPNDQPICTYDFAPRPTGPEAGGT